MLATLAAAGSTLLMLHFLRRLRSSARTDPDSAAPAGLAAPWLAMALASVAVPWALFLTAGIGTLADALAPAALWAALWPVLLGVALALACGASGTACRACRRATSWWWPNALRVAAGLRRRLERAEAVLRQWPVAGVSLLALMVILGAAIVGQIK